jgi:hypothetical protein
MQNLWKKLFQRSIILKTITIFLSAYLISLFLWVQIKDAYGNIITTTASRLIAEMKNVHIENKRKEKDTVYISFCKSMRKEDLVIELSFKTSSYTFNVPLTLSIMISLCLFITQKFRACAEAALLLVVVHFFYVVFSGAEHLTEIFMSRGIEGFSKFKLFLYQFFWGVTDNMLIRCEPFLIGFYMHVRFKKRIS